MNTRIGQVSIPTIDRMPALPQPLKILDWRAKARSFDELAFDHDRQGEYFPLIWTDRAHRNFEQDTFGLYTVVGDPRMGPHVRNGEAHEAITCIGAVLGGLMAGIDKTGQHGRDYVGACKNYFNSDTGWNIVMDYTSPRVQAAGGGYARSFWYDLFPNILFFALDSYCPGARDFERIVRRSAEQWQKAAHALNGTYEYTSFDFTTMSPVDNGRWREPDCAAGIAWLAFMAHTKFGDHEFLGTARRLLDDLERRETSPFYEVLLPFGTVAAARMNAEQGTSYDLGKLLDWCFTGKSACRPGWGVVTDRWGEHDMHGLQGSVTDSHGYAFAMNTFDMVAALLPVARYAPRYARAIGKWCLNAVNASRFFYTDELPPDNQTCGEYSEVVHGAIGYEGIRRYDKELLRSHNEDEARMRTPFAQGDSHKWGQRLGLAFPRISHLSLYGSSHVGLMASLVSKTDVDGILQLDCLASDFYHRQAYPTYLVYNPYDEAREVTLQDGANVGTRKDEPRRVYDVLTGGFLPIHDRAGRAGITLEGDTAALVVAIPSDAKIEERVGIEYAGGTAIRYSAARSTASGRSEQRNA
jgi:hypothetical protein